jgi:hypothetical protein
MGHGHEIKIDPQKLEDRFQLDGGTRKLFAGLIGVGLVFMIIGIILSMNQKADHAKGGHHGPAHTPDAKGGGKPHSAVPGTQVYQYAALQQDAQPADAAKAANTPDTAAKTDKADTTQAAATASAVTTDKAAASAAAAQRLSSKPLPGGLPGVVVEAPGLPPHEPLWWTRLLSNLLINTFFFTAIAGLAIFFIALKYATNAGWYVQHQRIAEAMGHFMFVGIPILLLIFFVGMKNIYHWTDAAVVAEDALLQKKAGYLNIPFFLVRNLIFFACWIGFFLALRNSSRREDLSGGIREYHKRVYLSAIFLIVFSLTFSGASWDWVMSVEAHWFSTMFGVRTFSTCFVSFWALMTLTSLYLQARGHLPYVNASHYHDLGKFMFAFTIFWAYIWFSEYMLIWYANIPEEGFYFYKRIQQYPISFFGMIALNFIIPFLTLLSKANMRNTSILIVVAFIILFGHWLDVYLMVMPGTMQGNSSIGFMEIGTFLLFLGLFIFVTATFLQKANLIPKNHPYLNESLLHQYH